MRLLGVSGLPSKQTGSHLPTAPVMGKCYSPHSSGWLDPSLPHTAAHADVGDCLLGDLNIAIGQIQSAEWSITA